MFAKVVAVLYGVAAAAMAKKKQKILLTAASQDSGPSYSELFNDIAPTAQLWRLEAAACTLVAGAVAAWDDLSGNGITFTQTNDADRPLYEEDVFMGGTYPGIQFDGLYDSLKIENMDTVTGGQHSSLIIFKPHSSPASPAYQNFYDIRGSDFIIYSYSDSSFNPYYYEGGYSSYATAGTIAGEQYIFMTTINGIVEMYRGASKLTMSSAFGTGNRRFNSGVNQAALGAYYQQNSRFFKGYIGAFVLWHETLGVPPDYADVKTRLEELGYSTYTAP